jgi:hypothetical protein
MTAGCQHGTGSHDGTEPSNATAPEASRAWLLIEHNGPWPANPAEAVLPPAARAAVSAAEPLGIRVQLIRKPGRLRNERASNVFAGWVVGGRPWLRHGTAGSLPTLDLSALAEGCTVTFGAPASGPLFLVCAHGRRDVCCARYGSPLARVLAMNYPDEVWETTHVGGHRYAANLVLLPHGLYYGPADVQSAARAISAYQDGRISPERYRGRAGSARDAQQAEHALLTRAEEPVAQRLPSSVGGLRPAVRPALAVVRSARGRSVTGRNRRRHFDRAAG